MPTPFFTGWATWEKLVFCLACAIVVTVLIGCVKLGHTHWRLRKYAALAEKERIERSVQRQMSQRRTAGTQSTDDVPFGIRAIESGIEVEGVWISRNNSPTCGMSRENSDGSSFLEQLATKDLGMDLEGQRTPQALDTHDRSRSSSITSTTRPSNSALHYALSTHQPSGAHASSAPNSTTSLPYSTVTKPLRSRHPPVSYQRYNDYPRANHQSSAVGTSEGLEATHKSSTDLKTNDCSGSFQGSDSSGHDFDTMSVSTATLLSVPPGSRRRQRSVDFDLLDSHRMSQAAETGQLTPRARKPAPQSTDLSNLVLPGPAPYADSVGDGAGNFFSPTQTAPSSPSCELGSCDGLFAAQEMDDTQSAGRGLSIPDITPFTQFSQDTPLSLESDRQRAGSMEVTMSSRPASEVYCTPDSTSSNPSRAASPTIEVISTEQPQSKRSSFECRQTQPQVIRGHGSGFEILRPGSFGAPPISLHNVAARPRSSSADSRRKLQKKARRSTESTRSSSTERREYGK